MSTDILAIDAHCYHQTDAHILDEYCAQNQKALLDMLFCLLPKYNSIVPIIISGNLNFNSTFTLDAVDVGIYVLCSTTLDILNFLIFSHKEIRFYTITLHINHCVILCDCECCEIICCIIWSTHLERSFRILVFHCWIND